MHPRQTRFAALAALLLLSACASTQRHGQSGLHAEYRGRDLTATLPADVTIPQAAAAAESALLRGGYTVSERTVAGDRARLVGRSPARTGLGPSPRPVIVIEPVTGGAKAIVTLEPFGDEEASRRLLDHMLLQLGL